MVVLLVVVQVVLVTVVETTTKIKEKEITIRLVCGLLRSSGRHLKG
jgi:hypothetical protein